MVKMKMHFTREQPKIFHSPKCDSLVRTHIVGLVSRWWKMHGKQTIRRKTRLLVITPIA